VTLRLRRAGLGLAIAGSIAGSFALAVAGSIAGCTPDPVGELPDAARVRADAALDAPAPDASSAPDAASLDAPGLTLADAWLERTDGCVSPLSLEGRGRPCLDVTDCAEGYACLPAGGIDPVPFCALVAIDGCACPAGATPRAHVTESAAYTICDAPGCPARDTDLGALGRPCVTLRDCGAWMICEDTGAGPRCELPCSSQCACPGGGACVARATASGVVSRCE
jgi:hypothetical protein